MLSAQRNTQDNVSFMGTASVLHTALSGSIKELTFASKAKEGRGDMTEQFARLGSHLSSLIRTTSPVPMHHTILFRITSLTPIMLFYA